MMPPYFWSATKIGRRSRSMRVSNEEGAEDLGAVLDADAERARRNRRRW